MKRKNIILVGFIIITLITGCQKTETNAEKDWKPEQDSNMEDNEMSEALITKEFLIKNCGISSEDLDGVDVDAFIQEFDLRESNVGNVNVPMLLELFKEGDEMGTSMYSYLQDGEYEQSGIKEEEIDSIRVAALYVTSGTYQETFLFDMKKASGYWGKEENLLDYWDDGCISIPLDEEKNGFFYKLIRETEMPSWNTIYKGTSEGTTGSFGWILYLELEDGKIYRYSGRGGQGESTPKQWNEFKTGIKKFFEE